MYLVLISALRFHLRGEGKPQKATRASMSDAEAGRAGGEEEDTLDRDDILSMSVGLESGTYKQRVKGLSGTFTFNPLSEDTGDKQPLYGL